MPPRRNRLQNLDFDIHIDPSCMSEPVDEHHQTPHVEGPMSTPEKQDEESVQFPVMDHWNEETETVHREETPAQSAAARPTAEESIRESLGDEDDTAQGEGNLDSRRQSAASAVTDGSERRESIRSTDTQDHNTSYYSNSGRRSYSEASESGRSGLSAEDEDRQTAGDEGGDSSSHHEHEDDVFSDDSPRSSMGSTSEVEQAKAAIAEQERTRSSRISGFSQYERDEEFVPTIRGTPRPAFRSPSSVKAMQMSSPPPSVLGSPRSARRTPKSAVSRIASPSVSTQYSPKRTPARFKRNTPPLVLLHVTLLPLRWGWGDVLDNTQTSDLSEEGKVLREAWRHLRDRVGDTVSDRGILLPHPQNDFEVLEERLLEALELPLRRRARILECGHYIGPSNEMTLTEDMESEGEEEYGSARPPRASVDKTTIHWCRTCESDIRCDSLGPGKVFRVKVYASNGLMKAGAWDACWKEMERVDVELEPLIDHRMLEELGHLHAEQERALEMQQAEEILAEANATEHEQYHDHSFEDHEEQHERDEEPTEPQVLHSTPPPEIHLDSSPVFEDRRRQDEDRLREIYGETQPAQPEPTTKNPRMSDFAPRETPPSPSAEAFERRQERRKADANASLPTLLLEAVRVLMQDKKNVMIALLTFLIMALATRGGRPTHDPVDFATVIGDAPSVLVQPENNVKSNVESPSRPSRRPESAETSNAYAQCSVALDEAQATIRELQATASAHQVVQTVTETIVQTATVEVRATATTSDVLQTGDVSVEDAPAEDAIVEDGNEVVAVGNGAAEGEVEGGLEEEQEREL